MAHGGLNVHQAVMVEEVMNFLNAGKGDVILDATIGAGGHAKEILKKIAPDGRLIGIDADAAVLERARAELAPFRGAFTLVHDNFRNVDEILASQNVKGLNAALFDLGVSSFQLEESQRGFSIRNNGRLDMRMDPRSSLTAYDVVNRYGEERLSQIIEKFGEERYHNRIARYIKEERSRKPIETTYELAHLIHRAVGHRYNRTRIDPATRTFQAIRIAVNDELNALEEAVKKVISWLKPAGRVCVISFHSLEDRIVKNLFKGYARLEVVRIMTKKPIRPDSAQISSNPRSRSARLRAAERMR